jgi:hypothetical protein
MTPEEIRKDLSDAIARYRKSHSHLPDTMELEIHRMTMNAEDVAQLAELNINLTKIINEMPKSEFDKVFGRRK